jgi:hypothetical protein
MTDFGDPIFRLRVKGQLQWRSQAGQYHNAPSILVVDENLLI